MKRRIAIITLSSLLGIFSTLQAEEEPVRRLLVLGDSLTKGYGVLETEAFPALLGKRLSEKEGAKWEVVNGGLSGDTSAGGLRRLTWLLKSKPDLLVIALGGNDGLRGIDPASTEKNLIDIIDKARSANPAMKILLAGIDVPENMGSEYIGRFKAVFPKVAKDKAVPLAPDLLEGVGGVSELNLADQIHPNAKGHERVAELVWKHLAPLVADDTVGE